MPKYKVGDRVLVKLIGRQNRGSDYQGHRGYDRWRAPASFIWGRHRSDLFVADCRRRSLTRMRSAFCVGQNLPQALDARVSYNIVQDALDYLTNIET